MNTLTEMIKQVLRKRNTNTPSSLCSTEDVDICDNNVLKTEFVSVSTETQSQDNVVNNDKNENMHYDADSIQCDANNEEIIIDTETKDAIVISGQDGEESVLDNIPCQTMIECCCQILDYLEQQKSYSTTDLTKAHNFIEQIIFEYIVRIGGKIINNDTVFHPIKHKPVEKVFISPGEHIGIVSPGILLDSKVLIKAKVKTVE